MLLCVKGSRLKHNHKEKMNAIITILRVLVSLSFLASAAFAELVVVPQGAVDIASEMVFAWFTEPPTPAAEVRVELREIAEIPAGFPSVFRVRMRDDSGAVEFFDEDGGEFICAVGGSSDFNKWLVADLRGAPRDPMLLPSRVERVYSLAASGSMSMAGRFGGLHFGEAQLRGAAAANAGLAFTGIHVESNGVSFSASWSFENPPPDGAFDLFGATNLVQSRWAWMSRFAGIGNATNVADFSLNENTVFPEARPLLDAMFASELSVLVGYSARTNPPIPSGLESFFPGDYVEGAIIEQPVYENIAAPSAFFRLGTLRDSDDDGLTDAFELLSSRSDPFDADSDDDGIPDGLEVMFGLDPMNELDASNPSPEPHIPWLVYARNDEFARVHVDCGYDGGAGAADGSASRPFTDVNDALNSIPASQPAIVLIAPGHYTGDGNSWITIDRPDLVLSANGPRGSVVFYCPGNSDMLFMFYDGSDRSSIITGVTVAGGYSMPMSSRGIITDCVFVSDAVLSGSECGAGILLQTSSFIVKNCVFYYSHYKRGQGMIIGTGSDSSGSTARIVNTYFINGGKEEDNAFYHIPVYADTNNGCSFDEGGELLRFEHCSFLTLAAREPKPPISKSFISGSNAVRFLNCVISDGYAAPSSAEGHTLENTVFAPLRKSGRSIPEAFEELKAPPAKGVDFDIDGFARNTNDGAGNIVNPGVSEFAYQDDADFDGLPDWWELAIFESLDYYDSEFDGEHKLPLGVCFRLGLVPYIDPVLRDSDNDGMLNTWEDEHGLDPTDPEDADDDPDNDGLSNLEEFLLDTNPRNPDTDNDGLADGWEAQRMPDFDPLDPFDGLFDADGDGLSFAQEHLTHGTDPHDWDTDGDGLSDGYEIQIGTNPLKWDSDGDGLSDGEEIEAGTDPNDPDSDDDGIDDGWEFKRGAFNPLDDSDGLADEDTDGLSNAEEINIYKTDWQNPDTDNDGINDGDEINYNYNGRHLNPLNPDTDGDGLLDGEELARGTNPNYYDSDNDGCPDGWEVRHGFDPLNDSDPPPDADPDFDHIPNLREAELGTDPFDDDTDDDGLNDNEEAGWIGGGFAPFNISCGVNLLSLISNLDYGSATLAFPFPIKIQGTSCSSITAHIDGHVSLQQTSSSDSALSLDAFHGDLEAFPAELGTSITFADITVGGARYCVIEYKNMGFNYSGADTNHMVSFQVAFQEGVDNFASVSFQKAVGRGDGRDAMLEARALHTTLQKSSYQAAVYAGLSIGYHLGTGTDPLSADADCDGLDDQAEILLGTNSRSTDSDNDGLSDAFEIENGFDPLTNNNTDSDPDNDANADPDNDGLSNAEEMDLGTDPHETDTDGDGISDGAEIAQGSDPLDPADNQPRDVVPVTILFGDESGSHSEKYKLVVTPVSRDGESEPLDPRPPMTLTNHEFGQPDPLTVMLVKNAIYDVTLEHVGTSPDHPEPNPDYDYTLLFPPESSAPSGWTVIYSDPHEILGVHGESGYFYAKGKSARIFVVRAGIVPDFNRDGAIDETDETLIQSKGVFRFWINDDRDEGFWGTNAKEDAPFGAYAIVRDDSEVRNRRRNSDDDAVNGVRDLVDFFTLRLDLPTKVEFPNLTYRLRHDYNALNFTYTSLAPETVGELYASECVSGFGKNGNESASSAKLQRIRPNEGTKLSNVWLDTRDDDQTSVVIMCEGKSAKNSPLVLEFDIDGEYAGEISLDISLSSVKDMFRYLNIRTADAYFTQDPNRPATQGMWGTRLNEPPNLPDSHLLAPDEIQKNIIAVHGLDWDEKETPAGYSEMFKRLYQSGSNARFIGVSWAADLARRSVGPVVYANDVIGAFVVAKLLNDTNILPAQFLGTDTTIIAHSLGNMVVSSAIQDYGLDVGNYVMLNPAVPSESYDGRAPASDPDRRNMTHPDWKGAASDGSQDYPERVTAAGWSKLFSDDDPRSKITWDNRFGGILDSTDVWQFYSSGEEILHESQGGVPPLLDWPWHLDETVMIGKEWVWVYHEITKGVINDVVGVLIKRHDNAGWAFNPAYDTNIYLGQTPAGPIYLTTHISASAANAMTDAALIANPVFKSFDDGEYPNTIPVWHDMDDWIYLPDNASPVLARLPRPPFQTKGMNVIKNHAKLLAEMIPPLSSPAGGRPITLLKKNVLEENRSFDLEESPYKNTAFWPETRPGKSRDQQDNKRWLHGDYKDAPFLLTQPLYKKIKTISE